MGAEKKLLYLHNATIGSTMANLVQVVSMCSAFADKGYQTVLVLRSSGEAAKNGQEILVTQFGCNPSVRLRLVKDCFSGKIGKHTTHLLMKRLIREEAPDFCMVRDPRYLNLVLSAGIPVVFELHNTRLHLGSAWLNGYFKKLVLKGSGDPLCLGVVCISHALAGYWRKEGVPDNKICVLHDGFAKEMFQKSITMQEARNHTGLPPEKKIVVYSGNLQANRGIRYILQLAEAFPDIHFILVGGTSERKHFYEEEVRERGMKNLVLIGHIPHQEVPMYLWSADILLAMWSKEVPTIMYCSPLKVFEYMASGVPAIMPGYPTILEVVSDGVEAILAEPDSPEGFIQALNRILEMDSDALESLSERARKRAFSAYTWEKRVDALMGILPADLRIL